MPPQFVEIIRSALAFAECGNFSSAAVKLGISRPTLRRHLNQLNDLCGASLMKRLDHTTYTLTETGEQVLTDAAAWLQQGAAILDQSDQTLTGLFHAHIDEPAEQLHLQQHSLDRVWEEGSEDLANAASAWMLARGDIDHEALLNIRKVAITIRLSDGEWRIVEIGEDTALAAWLGPAASRSSIGKTLRLTPLSSKADRFLVHPFHQAHLQGTPWYDHVSIRLAKPGELQRDDVQYRRLVLPCRFADDSRAVMSVSVMTGDLNIPGFDPGDATEDRRGHGSK